MTKPYDVYRPSDVPWVERVPIEWRTVPLFSVLEESKVKNEGLLESNLLSLSYGRIVRKDIDALGGLLPESFETYQIVEPNQLVFRFTDLQNDQRSLRSARVRERGIITSAYASARPIGIDPRFAEYLMRSYDTTKVFYGLGGGVRQSLKFSDVARLPVLLPTLTEQRNIADYLDRETARIDTLVEEQQQLMTLLADRKRAVLDEVTSAATGDQIRLRFLFAPSSEANHPLEEVLSVYRDYGVIPKSSRGDNFNRTPENVERYLLVQPGDLVVNRMKAWQGSLGISSHRGIVSGDYEVARPLTDRLLPRFAHLFMRSPKMIAEYAVRSTGIRPSQWRLYWDEMGDIEMPVPPHEEQAAVVDRLDEQTTKIDMLIAETERFVELSRERRAALITAVVTGQIDVRKVA